MDRTELIGLLTELDKRATPGPWMNGSWRGQCHKEHPHHGRGGDDPCKYDYTMMRGDDQDREVSLDGARTLIGHDEYDYVLRLDDARLIAELRTLLPDIITALKQTVTERT
jgi:hypothetical protein